MKKYYIFIAQFDVYMCHHGRITINPGCIYDGTKLIRPNIVIPEEIYSLIKKELFSYVKEIPKSTVDEILKLEEKEKEKITEFYDYKFKKIAAKMQQKDRKNG